MGFLTRFRKAGKTELKRLPAGTFTMDSRGRGGQLDGAARNFGGTSAGTLGKISWRSFRGRATRVCPCMNWW